MEKSIGNLEIPNVTEETHPHYIYLARNESDKNTSLVEQPNVVKKGDIYEDLEETLNNGRINCAVRQPQPKQDIPHEMSLSGASERVHLRPKTNTATNLRRDVYKSTQDLRPNSMTESSTGLKSSHRLNDIRKSFTLENKTLPALRPLSAIRPLSVSMSNLSHLSNSPLGRSEYQKFSVSTYGFRAQKIDYPKTRQKDGSPFQVDVLKGIAGIGIKVKVTSKGYAQITDIQKGGPVDKNGEVRVGDNILFVNNTELTGQTEARVQQVLRLLPRGLTKLVISSIQVSECERKQKDQAKLNAETSQRDQEKLLQNQSSTVHKEPPKVEVVSYRKMALSSHLQSSPNAARKGSIKSSSEAMGSEKMKATPIQHLKETTQQSLKTAHTAGDLFPSEVTNNNGEPLTLINEVDSRNTTGYDQKDINRPKIEEATFEGTEVLVSSHKSNVASGLQMVHDSRMKVLQSPTDSTTHSVGLAATVTDTEFTEQALKIDQAKSSQPLPTSILDNIDQSLLPASNTDHYILHSDRINLSEQSDNKTGQSTWIESSNSYLTLTSNTYQTVMPPDSVDKVAVATDNLAQSILSTNNSDQSVMLPNTDPSALSSNTIDQLIQSANNSNQAIWLPSVEHIAVSPNTIDQFTNVDRSVLLTSVDSNALSLNTIEQSTFAANETNQPTRIANSNGHSTLKDNTDQLILLSSNTSHSTIPSQFGYHSMAAPDQLEQSAMSSNNIDHSTLSTDNIGLPLLSSADTYQFQLHSSNTSKSSEHTNRKVIDTSTLSKLPVTSLSVVEEQLENFKSDVQSFNEQTPTVYKGVLVKLVESVDEEESDNTKHYRELPTDARSQQYTSANSTASSAITDNRSTPTTNAATRTDANANITTIPQQPVPKKRTLIKHSVDTGKSNAINTSLVPLHERRKNSIPALSSDPVDHWRTSPLYVSRSMSVSSPALSPRTTRSLERAHRSSEIRNDQIKTDLNAASPSAMGTAPSFSNSPTPVSSFRASRSLSVSSSDLSPRNTEHFYRESESINYPSKTFLSPASLNSALSPRRISSSHAPTFVYPTQYTPQSPDVNPGKLFEGKNRIAQQSPIHKTVHSQLYKAVHPDIYKSSSVALLDKRLMSQDVEDSNSYQSQAAAHQPYRKSSTSSMQSHVSPINNEVSIKGADTSMKKFDDLLRISSYEHTKSDQTDSLFEPQCEMEGSLLTNEDAKTVDNVLLKITEVKRPIASARNLKKTQLKETDQGYKDTEVKEFINTHTQRAKSIVIKDTRQQTLDNSSHLTNQSSDHSPKEIPNDHYNFSDSLEKEEVTLKIQFNNDSHDESTQEIHTCDENKTGVTGTNNNLDESDKLELSSKTSIGSSNNYAKMISRDSNHKTSTNVISNSESMQQTSRNEKGGPSPAESFFNETGHVFTYPKNGSAQDMLMINSYTNSSMNQSAHRENTMDINHPQHKIFAPEDSKRTSNYGFLSQSEATLNDNLISSDWSEDEPPPLPDAPPPLPNAPPPSFSLISTNITQEWGEQNDLSVISKTTKENTFEKQDDIVSSLSSNTDMKSTPLQLDSNLHTKHSTATDHSNSDGESHSSKTISLNTQMFNSDSYNVTASPEPQTSIVDSHFPAVSKEYQISNLDGYPANVSTERQMSNAGNHYATTSMGEIYGADDYNETTSADNQMSDVDSYHVVVAMEPRVANMGSYQATVSVKSSVSKMSGYNTNASEESPMFNRTHATVQSQMYATDSYHVREEIRMNSPSSVDMLSEDSGMPADEDQGMVTDDTTSTPGELADNTLGLDSLKHTPYPSDIAAGLFSSENDVTLPLLSITTEEENKHIMTANTEKDGDIQCDEILHQSQEKFDIFSEDTHVNGSLPPPILPVSSLPAFAAIAFPAEEFTTSPLGHAAGFQPGTRINTFPTGAVFNEKLKDLSSVHNDKGESKISSDLSLSSIHGDKEKKEISSDVILSSVHNGKEKQKISSDLSLSSIQYDKEITEIRPDVLSNGCFNINHEIMNDVAANNLIASVPKQNDPQSSESITETVVSKRKWCLRTNTTKSPVLVVEANVPVRPRYTEKSLLKCLSYDDLARFVDRANAVLDAASAPDSLAFTIVHMHRDADSVPLGVDLKHDGGIWFRVTGIKQGSPVWKEGGVTVGDWLLAVDSLWCDNITVMRFLSRLAKPKHDSLLVFCGQQNALDATDSTVPSMHEMLLGGSTSKYLPSDPERNMLSFFSDAAEASPDRFKSMGDKTIQDQNLLSKQVLELHHEQSVTTTEKAEPFLEHTPESSNDLLLLGLLELPQTSLKQEHVSLLEQISTQSNLTPSLSGPIPSLVHQVPPLSEQISHISGQVPPFPDQTPPLPAEAPPFSAGQTPPLLEENALVAEEGMPLLSNKEHRELILMEAISSQNEVLPVLQESQISQFSEKNSAFEKPLLQTNKSEQPLQMSTRAPLTQHKCELTTVVPEISTNSISSTQSVNTVSSIYDTNIRQPPSRSPHRRNEELSQTEFRGTRRYDHLRKTSRYCLGESLKDSPSATASMKAQPPAEKSVNSESVATVDPSVYTVVIIKGATGVGFCLEGGIGSPKGDVPITIKRIFKGGPADKSGLLKVNDEILEVNGLQFSKMRHYEAWNHLKFLDDGEIHITVRRV